MSDFLNNLLARTFVAESVLHPRTPSLFESAPIQTEMNVPSAWGEIAMEQATVRPVRATTVRQLPADYLMTPPVAVPKESLVAGLISQSENKTAPPEEHLGNLPARAKQVDRKRLSATSQEKFQPVESGEKKVEESKKESLLASRQPSLRPLLDEQSHEPHSLLETVVIEREVNRAQPRENVFAPVRVAALPTAPALPAATVPALTVPVLPTATRQPVREDWSPITNLVSETSAPTINVTIGRIEVKAVQSSGKENRQPAATRQAMSLNDYLRTRNGGRR